MQSVNVDRISLLETVKKNRAKHKQIFETAIQVYRKKVIKELQLRIKQAEQGKDIIRYITLEEPLNYIADYDKAIKMLEMSVDDNIRLEHNDFNCLVLDEWQWSKAFVSNSLPYLKATKIKKRSV